MGSFTQMTIRISGGFEANLFLNIEKHIDLGKIDLVLYISWALLASEIETIFFFKFHSHSFFPFQE